MKQVFQVAWRNVIGKRKEGTTHVIAESFQETVSTFEEMFPNRDIKAIVLVSTSVIETGVSKSTFHIPGGNIDYAEDDE